MTDVDPEVRKRRLKIAAAAAGAIVLVGGLVGIGIAALSGGDDTAAPEPSAPVDDETAAPEPSPSEPAGEVTDASVAERGWVPEPITSNPEAYGIAAAEAIWSYDAAASTHAEFIEWYTTWFSTRPDASDELREQDRADDDFASGIRRVLTNSDGWREQTLATTVMTATADVDGVLLDDEHTERTDESLIDFGIHRVTVPLTVRYEEKDVSTGETVIYENRLFQSVQVSCGDADVPEGWPADSCKVIAVYEEPAV